MISSSPRSAREVEAHSFNVNSTSAKLWGCFPVIGIYIGTRRIGDVFFPTNEVKPLCNITNTFKVIRGVIEISGTGIVLIPIDLFLWSIRAAVSYSPYKRGPGVHVDVSIPKSNKPITEDTEIIENLHKQGFHGPVDKGGGGRCLFLSIAPQITEADLLEAHVEMPFDLWLLNDLQEQADILRFWAMKNERAFVSKLPESYDRLNKEDRLWIKELYKDMLQEVAKVKAVDVCKRTATISKENRFAYVKENFEEYYKRTSGPTNWAGSPEAIALSRLFKRQIEIFGLDKASSEHVSVDDQGNVIPFCKYLGRNPPIYIFQCWGGGHYQLLSREALTS